MHIHWVKHFQIISMMTTSCCDRATLDLPTGGMVFSQTLLEVCMCVFYFQTFLCKWSGGSCLNEQIVNLQTSVTRDFSMVPKCTFKFLFQVKILIGVREDGLSG